MPSAPIQADPPDWLVLLADDLIRRVPSPASWAWDWGEGVMLFGLWKAYESTSKSSYFNYIRSYADRYVDAEGNISAHISNSAYVNHVAPGILLIHLYQETGDARYLKAANTIADYVMNQVIRTSNSALAHTNTDELWIDTLFMACVFLARMGALTGDAAFFDEAVLQIFAHAEKMYDETAHLFYHGWDENGSAAWSDPVTHRSPCFWSRGNGWAAAAIMEVLEWLPDTHGRKNDLESLAGEFLSAAAALQHPASGLWYTVMDQAGRSGNYLETSASALFVYAIQKGIDHGLLFPSLQENCNLGNQGLNTRISKPGTDVVVSSISEGTVVGNYSYYIGRALRNNLTWGIGSFLMAKTFYRPGLHPPAKVEDLTIGEAGPYVNLFWSPVLLDVRGQSLSSVSYRIYRSEDPCFQTSGTDSTDNGSAVSFCESSATGIGNPARNGFYRIRALNAKGMLSEPSVPVGEFDRILSPNPDKTDFHFIALPFSRPPVADAQSLVAGVANSNSAAVWDAAGQGYIQYLPKLPETNFPVSPWNAYFLNVS
ncbi:glycoside hydrolase family 88 protein, partial [bacterium]|nr:glycoside hydrolase family 88 protein [bacterium]